MFEVQKTSYGIRLSLKGFFDPQQAAEFHEKTQKFMQQMPKDFNALVDLRSVTVFSTEVVGIMKDQISGFREAGLTRSAVAFASAVMTLQGKRMATETGIAGFTRFFDASADPEWEKKAELWLTRGVEPAN